MKYVIRSLKYLVYFLVLFFIIVGAIFLLTSQKQPGLQFVDMFKEGALPQLAVLFAVAAAIYPALGFAKRKLYLNGEFSKYRDLCVTVMENSGYVLENENSEQITFRQKKQAFRVSRMWEDRITYNITDNPVIVEGYRKDITRVLSVINYRIREEDAGEGNTQQ